MESEIYKVFWFYVHLLEWGGRVTGLGYNLLSIIIFVFIQPALVIFFFMLWRYERWRRT